AHRGDGDGLVARARPVREVPEPEEPRLAALLRERAPERPDRLFELLHLATGDLVGLVYEEHPARIASVRTSAQGPRSGQARGLRRRPRRGSGRGGACPSTSIVASATSAARPSRRGRSRPPRAAASSSSATPPGACTTTSGSSWTGC